MVIAAGQQRSARGRAQRGGVKTVVAQTALGHAVERGGRYRTAKSARRTEAGIVGHDEQYVRRALGRRHGPWKVRFGFINFAADNSTERRVGNWKNRRATG